LFLARSWRRVWSERGWWHVGLFATLGVIPLLLAAAPFEWRTSSGFEMKEFGPVAYAMTEPGVIVHYLKLCFWPHPLCLDYSWPIASGAGAVLLPGLVIAALLVATAIALRRAPGIGFLGVWFFLILAPTSSFVPILDPAFEHRLYLPLAAVTLLAALAGAALLDRWAPGKAGSRWSWPAAGTTLLLTILLGTVTLRRNEDYRSASALWTRTLEVRPDQLRARINLANALDREGKIDLALLEAERAMREHPNNPAAHHALGNVLVRAGRLDEALPHLRAAAEGEPMNGEAHYLLGNALARRGQLDEALRHLIEAKRLDPRRLEVNADIGAVFDLRRMPARAIPYLQEALAIIPHDEESRLNLSIAHYNLGVAYAHLGDQTQARRELETTVGLAPEFDAARTMLDSLKGKSGR
jgi:Flp pilus assembly protein TadD